MATRKTSGTTTKPTPARKPAARKTTASSTKGNGAAKKSAVVMTLTHDQIARKAYEIWLAKGCPQGQDYANWKEAEAALQKA